MTIVNSVYKDDLNQVKPNVQLPLLTRRARCINITMGNVISEAATGGVFRNFAKFTGKQLCQSLFFKKVADLFCCFIKNRLWHRCFPLNFAKFRRTFFYRTHLGDCFW